MRLTELVVAARRAAARLESTVTTAVGEVDARGSHVHEGALTALAWLRRHARSTPAEATATVRTARELRSGRLPLTGEAFADGAISARHAQLIAARVADAPQDAAALIEPFAVEAAKNADVASGALIATAIDAAAPLVKDDQRTAAQRRPDGLSDICRRLLASPDPPGTGGGGAHPQVIVTTDHDTLRSRTGRTEPQPSPGAMPSWVGHITGTTAQRIACDATLTHTRIGPDGEVLDTSTERRFLTAAQRRAMIARDGDRRVWPWCDRPVSWSHGHHLQTWAEHGPTTVANGALPCEGHHVMVHEGTWALHRQPDGRYLARHPDGRTIGPQPHPPGHNGPVPHPPQ